jgi:site-specific recombinase XerD
MRRCQLGHLCTIHHDLEAVRTMLGHVRLETTQIYAQIRPAQIKRAVEFYEAKALDALGS